MDHLRDLQCHCTFMEGKDSSNIFHILCLLFVLCYRYSGSSGLQGWSTTNREAAIAEQLQGFGTRRLTTDMGRHEVSCFALDP